jgi:HD-like signal output (HDOD) protein/prolyl-tRNA editing enzyme YbaK/EbsC (Cys-tRNA(Pro) deacylase)
MHCQESANYGAAQQIMSIPAIISQALDSYSNADSSETPCSVSRLEVDPGNIIQLVLMNDDLGRAQVIFPGHRMLLIDNLNRAMGRSLTTVKQADLNELLDQYAIAALPAIPDITGLPSIIDESLFDMHGEYVYVDAGDPELLVQVPTSTFRNSIAKAQKSSFTEDVSAIELNATPEAEDQERIVKAIEKFTSLRIKQRIEDTLELPPLPQSAQDIIKLRANPEADSDELSNIVDTDPSLSAQVVSWASSSFYNAPGNVKSVHDAIIRVLGFDLVMNLSMGLSLGKTLNVPKNEPDGYLPYWQNALWMALGTTALISKIEPAYRPSFGMAYLSGLLHNFGHLVLAHVFPPHYELICRYREANPHLDSAVIEHHCLGITSEQIGSQLMAVWALPEQVVTAIRQQKNSSFGGTNCEYSRLLFLTRQLLAKKGIMPHVVSQPYQEILEFFRLTPEKTEEALGALFDSQDEVQAMASMMQPK